MMTLVCWKMENNINVFVNGRHSHIILQTEDDLNIEQMRYSLIWMEESLNYLLTASPSLFTWLARRSQWPVTTCGCQLLHTLKYFVKFFWCITNINVSTHICRTVKWTCQKNNKQTELNRNKLTDLKKSVGTIYTLLYF